METHTGPESSFLPFRLFDFALVESLVRMERGIVNRARKLGQDIVYPRHRILISLQSSIDLTIIDAGPILAFLVDKMRRKVARRPVKHLQCRGSS